MNGKDNCIGIISAYNQKAGCGKTGRDKGENSPKGGDRYQIETRSKTPLSMGNHLAAE